MLDGLLSGTARYLGCFFATVVVACVAVASVAHGQESPLLGAEGNTRQSDAVREIDLTDSSGTGFIAMSLPISNPTIGYGLGGLALFHYQLDPADTISPPSTTLFAAGYKRGATHGEGHPRYVVARRPS